MERNKETESLSMEGLEIKDIEDDSNAADRTQNTREIENEAQKCRRVDTRPPKKEQHEIDYQFTAEETLKIAIYQCKADLNRFGGRYKVEEIIYECNMRTKLRERF